MASLSSSSLDFLTAESRQALQTQVENGFRLLESTDRIVPSSADAVARIVDQRAAWPRHRARANRATSGCRAPRGGIGRGPDDADHLVDIGNRNRQTDQDMRAVARLVEQELGASRHDLSLAERDEDRQQVLQRA